MAKYLLDTTALIDHLRGRKEVVDLITALAKEGHLIGVCCINVAELHAGLGQTERPMADHLLDSLEFYEVTRDTAKQAGRYRYDFARKGMALAMADALIAATAVNQEATLVTANTRDFPMTELRLLGHP